MASERFHQYTSTEADLKRVFDRILRNAVKLVRARDGSLMLLEEGELRFYARYGLLSEGQEERTFKVGEGVAGWVAQKGEPYVCRDTREDSHFTAIVAGDPIRSLVSVPIKSHDQVLGVINVDSADPDRFSDDAAESLVIFANQAAAVIEWAERAAQLERLQKVTAAISVQTADLNAVLRLIVDSLTDIFYGASCAVRLYDSSTDQFTPHVATGILTDLVGSPPRAKGIGTSRYIVETKNSRYLEGDELTNPLDGGPSVREDILGRKVKAAAYLPLLSEAEVIGILYVDLITPHHFSQNDKQILKLFADQATIAIQNARQRFEDITALREVNQAITTVETETLNEVLQLVVDRLINVFQAVSCAIRLYDPNTCEYGDRITSGILQDIPDYSPRSGGSSEHILQHKEPIYAEDVSAVLPGGEQAIRDEFQKKGVQAIAYLPLLSEGDIIGILYTEWDSPRRFYENDKQMLELFAGQAAVAIKNAQLYRSEQKRSIHLATVSKVARQTALILNLDQLASKIVDAVRMSFDYHSVSLFLLDETGTDLRMLDIAGFFKDVAAPDYHQAVGKGMIGWSAKTGQSLLANDVSKDPHYIPGYLDEPLTKAELCAPLKVAGRVIGVLDVQDTKLNAFDETDLRAMEILADQIAIAVENARLYEQRVEDMTALQAIDEAVTSKGRDEVLQLIVKEAVDRMPGEYSSLWLKELRTDDLVLVAASGAAEAAAQKVGRLRAKDASISRQVAESGKPRICKDVSKEPAFYRIYKAAQSSVTVPLKIHDKVMGTLNVESPRLGAFAEQHSRLLESFAGQAAIAIENARLFEELNERATQLEQLQTVTATISAESFDLDNALRLIAKSLGEIFEDASCTIRLYDSETGEFTARAATGLLEKLADSSPRADGVSRHVIKTRKPRYLVGDDLAKPPDKGPAVHKAIRDRGVKATAILPLVSKKDIIGILYVDLPTLYEFSSNDRRILELFADQAAIAIENTNLLQQERQRAEALDLLQKVSGKISSLLDLYDTLVLILEGGMRLTGMESGVVHLVDETGQSIVHSYEFPAGFDHPIPRLSKKESMTRTIIKSGKLIAVPDITQEPRVNPVMAEKGIRSLIGLPLKLKDKVIGVLYLNATQPHQFTDEEQVLLLTLADQAAIAIEEARLYEQLLDANKQLDYLLNRKVKDLQAINKVGQTLTSSIGLSEKQILGLIYEQATLLMDTSDMYIALYDPDPDQPDEYDPDELEKSIVHGTVRFGLAMNNGKPVNTEREEGWGARRADEKPGLTEYVIRTRQAHRPEDVREAYKTYATEHIGKIPRSWMGVPMMAENEVLGVVVLRNDERENAYDEDDRDVLQTIAGQSAIALQNARLVRQLQQRIEELNTLRELAEELSAGVLPDVV